MIRFVYGFILGVLTTVIAAILYLAFAGGEYLLQLSPRYHDMASNLTAMKETKEQRDQLADRLDALADGFDQLTRRFNELRETRDAARRPGPEPETPPQAPTPPHPKPRVEAPPAPAPAAPPGA
jgi:hypothetical protein